MQEATAELVSSSEVSTIVIVFCKVSLLRSRGGGGGVPNGSPVAPGPRLFFPGSTPG